jgi:two-component system, NtrC family, sensor kinase
VDDLPILFVDDEADVLRALGRTAERQGWRAVLASGGADALEKLAAQTFAVVISDFRMPGMDGIEFLAQVRQRHPDVERVLLTAYADIDALERGINDAGIGRFLRKPWSREMLVEIIEQCLLVGRMRRERQVLLERIENRNQELVYLNELLRKDADESARAAVGYRRRWDAALHAISDPILIVSNELRVEVANDAAARVAGKPSTELEGHTCHEVLFGSAAVCDGCPIEKSAGRVRQRGKVYDAHAYPLPGAHLCVYRDVTREVAMQEQAVHVEKMAAIGRLAGGVAHELNNPLHGILSFVQLAQKPEVPKEKLSRFHEVIMECALRCRDIVQSLRDFSRSAPVEKRAVPLSEICAKALVLFAALEERIDVEHRDSAHAFGNSNQLQQIVVNLIQNAADATAGNARIRVTSFADGEHAVIAVEDAGPGVPLEQRERIFEPFFTTKPEGVGTGLGLAISHSLTTEHGGTLRVFDSGLGGARFELRLPLFRRTE